MIVCLPDLLQMKTDVLQKYNLTVKSVSLFTEDGASNNKKSAKLIRAPFTVCFPHDLQRAVLFAAGEAGSPSQNVDLKTFIASASRMAGASHRSVQVTKAMEKAQIASFGNGVRGQVIVTETRNITRWTGLYRMAHKNRRLESALTISLTGSPCGRADEEPADVQSSPDVTSSESNCDSSEDEDEVVIARNIAAGKQFPLAHRLLDRAGFRNNSLLESVLHSPHEVCLLLQKHSGMGLSLAFQLIVVLQQNTEADKLWIVAGQTKEGDWTEVQGCNLPTMFKKFRSILSDQLKERFKVSTTPSKYVLLALAMDPSVDTSPTGIFQDRCAAQSLLEGEYRRALRRRQIAITPLKEKGRSLSGEGSSGGSSSTAQRTAQAAVPTPKQAGKRPMGILGLVGAPLSKTPVTPGGATETLNKDEIMLTAEMDKFRGLCEAVLNEGHTHRFYEKGVFSQSRFWSEYAASMPIHYAEFVGGVGTMKAASANVETVFSGAGSMMRTSGRLGPTLLSDYAFCHVNWQYDFLRPSKKEVTSMYSTLYGKKGQHESDCDTQNSSSDSNESDDGIQEQEEEEEHQQQQQEEQEV